MLTQEQIDVIVNTMMPYKPIRIGVFGSVARNEETEDSDIDLLYMFGEKYSLFDLAGIQYSLQNLLNRNVDLVEFSSVHPRLKDSIFPEMKIIYGH